MPLYVALGKVTPVGAVDLKGSRERLEENRKAFEAYGARILSGYAVLGHYDFLFIIEAPDNETVLRLSAMTASRGTSLYETLPIVPLEDFLQITDEIEAGRAGL